MKPLQLGFSPCPNDTFIFADLVAAQARLAQPLLQPPFLEDVETLNRWALQGNLEITKLSFHALGHVLDRYCVLSAGSALGRGCGPLLIGKTKLTARQISEARIAIPGRYTTAAMLFRMFQPSCNRLVEMSFDAIIDSVAQGSVDGGVIIHESRFTYQERDLVCIQDLGQWWEETSGLPIPLGCIAMRRDVQPHLREEITRLIQDSLQAAWQQPHHYADYIRAHAQETSEQVIAEHIKLYVNDFSYSLGAEGRAAVESFMLRGREANILPQAEQSPFCSDG